MSVSTPSRLSAAAEDHAEAAAQLSLDTIVDDYAVTMELAGELDLTTAPLLIAAVESQLARGRHSVRLDLSRTTFCDCAGLGAIVHVRNRVQDCGETFTLSGAGLRVDRLFRLAGLDRVRESTRELPARNDGV